MIPRYMGSKVAEDAVTRCQTLAGWLRAILMQNHKDASGMRCGIQQMGSHVNDEQFNIKVVLVEAKIPNDCRVQIRILCRSQFEVQFYV